MASASTENTPGELATPTRAFINGLADEAGHLHAEALFAAAEAAGFTATKLRLAIKRMGDGGLLTTTGRGRKAEVQLTSAGLEARRPDLFWTAVAYRADAGLDRWDGYWHLAAFEIPEEQRKARDDLRNQIHDLFGAQLTSGLYLSPFTWEPWLVAMADVHGVRDRLTTTRTTELHHGGSADPSVIAAMVWPVEELDATYRRFIDRWEPTVAAMPDEETAAVRLAFEAAAEFEAVFSRDPLLPAALLPAGYAGPRARRLYVELTEAFGHHELLARANLFGAHRAAIESALTADQDRFWIQGFAETSRR